MKALPWKALPKAARIARIREIDQDAFDREWRQNLAGENPNPTLSRKQLDEAIAWGNGARTCLGIWVAFPSCYDVGRP